MTGRITTCCAVSAVALVACAVLAVTGFDAPPMWERMDVGQLRELRGGAELCWVQDVLYCRADNPCNWEEECDLPEGEEVEYCLKLEGEYLLDPQIDRYSVVWPTEPPYGNEGYIENDPFVCSTNEVCEDRCKEFFGTWFCVRDEELGDDDKETVHDTLVDGDTCDQQS